MAQEGISKECLEILVENGIPESRAIELLKENNNDLGQCIDIYFKELQKKQKDEHVATASHGASHDASTDDAIFQQVLNESRQENAWENSQMQISQEEQDLNKVIEQSLQDTSPSNVALAAAYSNPNFRKREKTDKYVGLKNIGNTCYFNSMLQTYYMIPQLREAVLSFPYNMEVKEQDPEKDTIIFMKELQRLFVFLMHSNQKYVDPSQLLQKTMGDDGKPVTIGNQEDVADFNDLFLRRIFKGVEIENQQEKTDFLKRMFWGSAIEYIDAAEENGELIELKKETEFTTLILPLTDDGSDLFSCLDNYVLNNIEFTTEKGFKTTAQSCLWIDKAPEMLLFQESRVIYDTEQKRFIKKEVPINFPKELYIDRYLIKNKEKTTQRRAIVGEWTRELEKLQAELSQYTNYKGMKHSLDDALKSVILYSKDKAEKESQQVFSSVVEALEHEYDIVSKKMDDLRTRIRELQTKIDTAYQDMTEKAYSLFAVWIHQGVAGSGHYWANICDVKTGEWTKFNDLRVNTIIEEEVLQEATGGTGSTSAYFLIYLSKDLLKKSMEDIKLEALIPTALIEDVQRDNEKFMKELNDYEKTHAKDKLSQFVSKYQEKLKEIEVESQHKIDDAQDIRIKSFLVFLEKLGLHEMMIAEVFREMYLQVFQRTIDKDIGYDIYTRVSERVGDEIVQIATKYSLDDSQIAYWKNQYQIFQDVAVLYHEGLTLLIEHRYDVSLRNFISALAKDHDITNPLASRRAALQEVIFVGLNQLFEEAASKFDHNNFHITAPSFRSIQSYCCYAFPKGSPIRDNIRNKLSTFLEQIPNVPSAVSSSLQGIISKFDQEDQSSLGFGLLQSKKMEEKQYEEIAIDIPRKLRECESRFLTPINLVRTILQSIQQQHENHPGNPPRETETTSTPSLETSEIDIMN